MHKYHVTIIILSIVFGALFYLVVSTISPTVDGQVNIISLLLAAIPLSLALTGVVSLVSYAIRHVKNPFKQHRQQMRLALFQGLRISLGVVFLGMLTVANLLNVVSLLLTVALIITIESMM